MRALGVISGTSMDAVDVACVETDGEGRIVRGPGLARPYTEAERATIRAATADAMAALSMDYRSPLMVAAEAAITEAHGEAIAQFLAIHGAVDVIGWHGQTLAHAPQRRITIQLGDAAALAARFHTPVVAELRRADVSAGGEGAPLVPVYHRALVRQAGLAEPALIINLGGVANVTYIDGEILYAFDTGPASALMDDAMAEVGKAYDAGGRLAATGTVDEATLAALLAHPYFAAPLPKSLDRDAFAMHDLSALALADRLATLARFSAEALGLGVRLLPKPPASVIAAGGGVHNETLMAGLADVLGQPILTADGAGFSSDFMEAEAFAYLAVRSLHGLPITFPGTTGIRTPLTGGKLFWPAKSS